MNFINWTKLPMHKLVSIFISHKHRKLSSVMTRILTVKQATWVHFLTCFVILFGKFYFVENPKLDKNYEKLEKIMKAIYLVRIFD